MYRGIEMSYRRIVKALIGSGANPHLPGHNGDTPLHLAAILGDIEIVESLLECGVDLHTSNGDGDIPLVFAIRHGKKSVSKKILECGAVDIYGEDGKKAITEASSVGDLALVEMIYEKYISQARPNRLDGSPVVWPPSNRSAPPRKSV
ncbi:ankyrin protein [Fusarium pseudoanthophilum]|uniref:Ankyrin protein n=1 Tax=Fusarium pseudoanthophilum TaxID=48495 RepID=A0A8H5Q6A3_9HYPO|nr:ankyrin protein [Fusarium pseudoanthophilum]